MIRRLPSLNALKAFEAAARHLSFTRAAEELCVTQGAVSHQVKALEADLGLRLFHRHTQALELTEVGRQYQEVARDALDRIALGTEQLLRRQSSGVLTVAVSPSFAAKWLVHRLGRFADAHPEIELRITSSTRRVDFAREDVDVAVRYGEGNWPSLSATRLLREEMFPVCSPRLCDGPRGLRGPEDLARHALLHTDGPSEWRQWLEAAGVTGVNPTRGPIFNRESLAVDAAIEGQGVAMSRTALVIHDLRIGRLVRPFPYALPMSKTYWIACPKATADLPKIAMFREWMLREASADAAAAACGDGTPETFK